MADGHRHKSNCKQLNYGMRKHHWSTEEPKVFMKQKSLTRVLCQLIFIIENGNIAFSFERSNYTVVQTPVGT